jgi:hypothetical protein
MSDTIKSDALITEADVASIKADVDRGEYNRLVFELTAREPDLAIFVSEKYALISTLLDGQAIPADIRDRVQKHMSLLVWTPLLLFDRVQRRAWNEFLPSEDDFLAGEPPVNEDGHVCEPEDRLEGIIVGIHIERLRMLCPGLDEASLLRRVERHGAVIAHEMLEAGLAAAERLFASEGDQP